jgi:hydroxybutyrate-dimer hydrolase
MPRRALPAPPRALWPLWRWALDCLPLAVVVTCLRSPARQLPAGFTQQGVTVYSATTVGAGTTAATQDLLTAGLGKTGLGAAAPAFVNALAPTALELRRNAIHGNYRGLVDITANGGYGTLYGPNIDASGTVTAGEGLIPGREYIASLDDGSGRKRVVVAVQIPESFNQASPCVILGPSSGSRGVYGAVAAASEWGLKKGCAVALTDAGKGVGLYDMTDDTVNRIDGTRATKADAGALNFFSAFLTDSVRIAYNALFPNRLALKQVHSQLNPEKDWGNDTLASARYALYALNDRYGTTAAPLPFTSANTLIIGASVSNGGGAVLRAAEQDTSGLIDGVVAGEPNAQPQTTAGYDVQLGGVAVAARGKSTIDYTTYGNIYQPCAALSAPASMGLEVSFHNYIFLAGMTARADARCASLAAKGLVTGPDTATRSLDALNKLRAYGWTADNDIMHSAHYGLGNGPILSAMYPVSYGKFPVTDNVCNTSFAQANAVTGSPEAVTPTVKAGVFATANGTANGQPAAVIYNDSVGGAKLWSVATSVSTGTADFGLDNALCQRALVTGVDTVTSAALTTATFPTLSQSQAVRAGMADVLFNGNLQARPTLVVAGRSDALLPVNQAARAYVAYNRSVEGAASKVRYVEVTNAQHFDSFLGLSGFDTRYVPLHVYFVRAMDAMYAHLKSGTALPASQVVRTTPRGGLPGAAPAISGVNVPAISAAPAGGDSIVFSGTALNVPN